MKYGHRIAELREQKGWTQEELSASIGISRAALSHYEKNRRKPDYETLDRLADLFQVSIDYLLGRGRCPRIRPDRNPSIRKNEPSATHGLQQI